MRYRRKSSGLGATVPPLPGWAAAGTTPGATDAPGRSLGPEAHLVEPATDRAALYRSAYGLEWRRGTNWLSAASLAAWHGATTDRGGPPADSELRGDRPSRRADLRTARGSDGH